MFAFNHASTIRPHGRPPSRWTGNNGQPRPDPCLRCPPVRSWKPRKTLNDTKNDREKKSIRIDSYWQVERFVQSQSWGSQQVHELRIQGQRMIFNPKIEIGRRTRASFPIPAFAISFSSFVYFVFFVVCFSSLSGLERRFCWAGCLSLTPLPTCWHPVRGANLYSFSTFPGVSLRSTPG